MKDNPTIRQAYQELLGRFEEEGIESILFTTFNFSSGFFEKNVLPLIGGNDIDEIANLEASQVNDTLLKTRVTVVCDHSTNPDPKGNYRYGLLTVGLENAYFHPKIILATGKLKNGELGAVMLVGSCNLSLSGWGLNREVAGLCAIGKQQRKNLIPLLKWIQDCANKEANHLQLTDTQQIEEGAIRSNITNILDFVDFYCGKTLVGEPDFFARVPGKDQTGTFLASLLSPIGKSFKSCRIVSPFWSEQETLETFFKELNCQQMAFVPSTNNEGQYKFPQSVRKYLNNGQQSYSYQSFAENDRYTHAKSVTLNTNEETYYLIGSANFTRAAMGPLNQGNVEVMLSYSFTNPQNVTQTFCDLIEGDMKWADDSEAMEEAPPISPYIVYAAYDWATKTLSCEFECSELAYKNLCSVIFNNKTLNFELKDNCYFAKLQIEVKKPIYFINFHYSDGEKKILFRALVTQWNAEDDQLAYSPKPQLSKILDQLRELNPSKPPGRGGGFTRTSSSESNEPENENTEVFDFFSMFQAFYKLREFFDKHPKLSPFSGSTPNSLVIIYRAIAWELDDIKNERSEIKEEHLIQHFILLSELKHTAKKLATTHQGEETDKLLTQIEESVTELEPDFKNLIKNSSILKQFLHIDVVDENVLDTIYSWFKEQLDYPHE